MKGILLLIITLLLPFLSNGQGLPSLKLSDNRRYLVTADNRPFFWLGDTAWELIHRLDKGQIDLYLKDRSDKGFNLIQTVVLAELDGLNTPNAYGDKPLIDNNPEKLNEAYFALVDYLVEKAGTMGMYIGLLPTWGDKFNKKWGTGPEIFTPENAKKFGELLAKRYKDHTNIIWIMGGDRAMEEERHYRIVRSMAEGIRSLDQQHLITFHPVGGRKATDFFGKESWLDMDMFQSGHSRMAKDYQFVLASRALDPLRPVINGEARYENIPDRFWDDEHHGWLDAADVRIAGYWSMLAGAAGYTYGCNDVWQMYETSRDPVINARTGWQAALSLPGASQMGYMKKIFEALPWQQLEMDQGLIIGENPENESHIVAARTKTSDLVLAYTPIGSPINIDLTKMNAPSIKAWWYNPRNGKIAAIGDFETNAPHKFTPWAYGWGSDFLLLLTASESKVDFTHFME
ncbi:Putative collagen-binding domain of a collagenase [Cyclobacterium lianum]|uniref:Putative collagen-binding domain of a collagenase n=1 Tax=Cyclobacterium lianum TaxID=388280 RepID=A0A1M7LK37_9BACT|nr:glycoside hydrolase family 140 protein [Cyclobacterium lianum]SHM78483.1 Putative collagen-binding domain of a collagenase [Cyclobacterium lianum]